MLPSPFVLRFLVLFVVATLTTTLAADDKPVSKPDDKPAVPAAKPAGPVAVIHEHRQRGRYEEALDAADVHLKTNPDDRSAVIERARVFLETGRLAEAEAALEQLVKKSPTAGEWGWLAEVRFDRGRLKEADDAVSRGLALDENAVRCRLIQAHLLSAKGDVKAANEAFRWFVRYYNKAQPKDAETLLLVARGASEYARWNGVSQIFEFVVNTLAPDALAADPACWQAHALAGALLVEKYNEAQGFPELQAALAINPHAVATHLTLARAKFEDRDFPAAERSLAAARETWPDCPTACAIEARIRLATDDLVAARAAIDRGLIVSPNDEALLGLFAVCELPEISPRLVPAVDDLLANFATLPTQPEPAASDRFALALRRIARVNPRPAESFETIGQTLENRRQFALAERFYTSACEVAPQRGDCRSALGLLYMNMGRSDDAKRVLDEALRKDPYHVRAANMRKVIDVLDTYPPVTTDHFVVRFDSKADVVLGRMVAAFLEREYPDLIAKYGYEPTTRTQFEIYHKAKGRSGHQWFSTRMIGLPWIQTIGASTGMMVALSSPTSSDRPYNWARVLRHEYVHILTLQRTGFNIPHWYTEALAVQSEEYPRAEDWDLLMVRRAKSGKLFNLDTINKGFQQPKSADDWTQAYSQAQFYAAYLEQTYGPDAPAKLLKAFDSTRDPAAALKLAVGVDKPVFEAGYRKAIDDLVAATEKVAPTELPAPAEAEKKYTANPDDVTAAGQFAWIQFENGNRKAARAIAEKVHAANKAEPWSALTLASLSKRAEDITQTLEYLHAAWNPAQPFAPIVDLLGLVHLERKEYAEAVRVYDAGLSTRPRNVGWWKKKAVAELRGKDDAGLRKSLEEIARLDADDVSVRRKRAELAWTDGDVENTIQYARLALDIDVRPAELHVLLARALAKRGDHLEALFYWENAALLKPKEADWLSETTATIDALGDTAKTRIAALAKQQPDNTLLESLTKDAGK
jgi:tetratricopeptide (TPR) repeat protein